MSNLPLSPDWTVADLLRAWPQAIPVFLAHQLGCVGCDMAPFDTLADVARIYELDAEGFLEELRKVLRAGEGSEAGKGRPRPE